MREAKRALLLLLLLSILSISVASTVMIFWYHSTSVNIRQRLIDITDAKRRTFSSVYFASGADTAPDKAVSSAIRYTVLSASQTKYGRGAKPSFSFAWRDGAKTFVYTASKHGIRKYQIKSDGLPSDLPLARALSGKKGVKEGHDIDNDDILAAYDFFDAGNTRFAFCTAVEKAELQKPKIYAAFSACAIALIIIMGGGLTFYRFSYNNVRKLTTAYEGLSVFAHIIDSVDEYIAFISPDMKYAAANIHFLSLFDLTEQELKGKSFGAIFNTQNEYNTEEIVNRCLNGEKVSLKVWLDVPKFGKVFAEIKLLPHYVDGKIAGIVLSASNRTEDEMMKQSLIHTAQDLKTISEKLEDRVREETEKRISNERVLFEQKKFADMGQMINAIAHQWRQPINSIGLYIQLIYDSIKDGSLDDETLESFKTDSMKMVQHMSKTIDDFRSFFNPKVNEHSFEVIKAIIDTVSLVEAQLKNNGISFTISCKCTEKEFEACNNMSHPPCKHPETLVAGTASEFRQVLMNLVQNAKDALTEITGVKFIHISVIADDNNVIIRIADKGGGIPLDIIERIFEPYFTTKPEGKGTGIGLYMSRTIVEEHMNGRLTVENADDGSIFTIRLKKLKPTE